MSDPGITFEQLRTPDEIAAIRRELEELWHMSPGRANTECTFRDDRWPNQFRFNGDELYGHLSPTSGEVLLD